MVQKKKREHKVSRGEHGAGGRTRLSEHTRPASIRGGIVTKFKPIPQQHPKEVSTNGE